jgi:hypothetical protein
VIRGDAAVASSLHASKGEAVALAIEIAERVCGTVRVRAGSHGVPGVRSQRPGVSRAIRFSPRRPARRSASSASRARLGHECRSNRALRRSPRSPSGARGPARRRRGHIYGVHDGTRDSPRSAASFLGSTSQTLDRGKLKTNVLEKGGAPPGRVCGCFQALVLVHCRTLAGIFARSAVQVASLAACPSAAKGVRSLGVRRPMGPLQDGRTQGVGRLGLRI